MTPTVEYMEITPQMAREMLGKSKGNPRWTSGKIVNMESAKRIAADIANGDWHLGSGDIIFDENGVLVDGHTRLTAITLANKAVPCFVKRGITEAGLIHIDDNKARTASQRLHVHANILGAAALHYMMLGGVEYGARQLTTEQKRRWVELHPCLPDCLSIVDKKGSGRCITKNAASVHATMCAFEYGVSGTKLRRFFAVVNNGYADSPEESSAITIRNFIINGKKSAHLLDYREKMSVVIQRGISDFTQGIPRTTPYIPRTDVGYYFLLNSRNGDKRYSDMYGE